jgi:stress response protein SCP2
MEVDIDGCVIMKKNEDVAYERVSHRTETSSCGSVSLSRDNADDETAAEGSKKLIAFAPAEKLPADCNELDVWFLIKDGTDKKQHFSMVKEGKWHVFKGAHTNKSEVGELEELGQYEIKLCEDLKFENIQVTGIHAGRVYLNGGQWYFELTWGLYACDDTELMHFRYGWKKDWMEATEA